jgi:hypothetical protein
MAFMPYRKHIKKKLKITKQNDDARVRNKVRKQKKKKAVACCERMWMNLSLKVCFWK